MGYIGSQPATNFETVRKQVSTTNSGTTITLDYSVSSVQDILVTVNAVVQSYDNYTVSGTTLTLGGTLNNDRVEILYVGRTFQTVTPAIGTVTSDMLAGSIANSKLANSSISINGSSVSLGGSLTGIGGANTPNFHIKNSTSSISNTTAKVLFTTEEFDTGNLVSSSRFTVDANTTGKYFLYASVKYAASSMSRNNLMIYKNGTLTLRTEYGNSSTYPSVNVSGVLNLSSSGDYVEVYADQNQGSNISLSGEAECNYFGGYKIIE